MNSTVVIGTQRISSLEEIKKVFQKEIGIEILQASNPLYVSFESIGFPERVVDIVTEMSNTYPFMDGLWAEILYMDYPTKMATYRRFSDFIWTEEKTDNRNFYIIGKEFYYSDISLAEARQLEKEKKIFRVNAKYLEKMFNLKMLDPDLVKILINDSSNK